jgi:predicted RNase H-like HicB family nuclease
MGTQSREPRENETIAVFESDGFIVARDEETGIASQGETKSEALANLAESLQLHERPVPDDEVEDAQAPWFDS